MKTWRLATDIVQEALRAEGFKGTFHLMGIDKVTWRGVHNPPWKVNRVEGNAVILVIKPPRRGEGECWQYSLQCPGSLATDVEARLRRAAKPDLEEELLDDELDEVDVPPEINGNGKQMPPVIREAPATVPEPTSPNTMDVANRLIARISRLSEITDRTRKRQERLLNVRQKRDDMQRQMREIQAKIDEYEMAEMEIQDEEKSDVEAAQASEALVSLERLLTVV